MTFRRKKSIGELVEGVSSFLPEQVLQTRISGLALHSDQIGSGWGFVCLSSWGKDLDSQNELRYARLAQAKGAAAFFVEKGREKFYAESFPGMPIAPINELRAHLGHLADAYYGKDKLEWFGITGTNGKSSVADLIARGLNQLGVPCGVVGTVYRGMPDQPNSAQGITTPDVFEMRRLGARFARQNVFNAAVECSSHGLMQERLSGLNIRCGVFTNLSAEHRDYHKNFEEYAAAKKKLFARPELQMAVFNWDDAYGREWHTNYRLSKKCLSFSLRDKRADIFPLAVQRHLNGMRAEVQTPLGKGILRSSIPTLWILANKMAALSALLLLGKGLHKSLKALNRSDGLRGRMQKLKVANKNYFVDYAHTPDAFAATLKDLRSICSGKLWVLFGCGGERDKEKRGEMGALAAHYADRVIVTNDNPRSEKPGDIFADIIGGMSSVGQRMQLVVEADRRKALEIAVRETKQGDIVLVAGKGHEVYQEIRGRRYRFDDYAYLNQMARAENV